jgi:hypothetical protein
MSVLLMAVLAGRSVLVVLLLVLLVQAWPPKAGRL